VDEKRTAVIYVRVTEQEEREFQADADKRRMTKAEFFRYIWQAFKDKLTKEKRP
jgi:hypothetical protein